MTRNRTLIGLVVAALLVIAGGYYYFVMRDSDAMVPASSVAALPGYTILPSDHALGNPKAKVVLIEYAAPSCPVCAAFNADSFAQIKQDYIDTGKVLYVFRVFPIRADDGSAEKIASCAPAEHYFSVIDLFFRNQPMWDVENGVLDVHGGMVRVAQLAGMSGDQVDKCLSNPEADARINKVAADGEARYKVDSTPTFVVNGVVRGQHTLPTYTDMQGFLDAAAR